MDPRRSRIKNANQALYRKLRLRLCENHTALLSPCESNNNTMQATVVSLFCLLAAAVAFVPVAPICRNAGSKIVSPVSTSTVVSRSRVIAPLSMGFDFKGMMEKMSDSRYARVRHILVDEKGEEGRARLEQVKEEIAGDLDKFSEMAEKISTCTSAVRRA